MADQTQPPATGLRIPPDVQQAFGPLLALIKTSESMNNEERQYWINILPVMTAEQLKNLEDILVNERKQLAAIDAKYRQQMSAPGAERSTADVEQERRMKRQQRSQAERQHSKQEEGEEEQILKEIENL